jgi:hypothetical protein
MKKSRNLNAKSKSNENILMLRLFRHKMISIVKYFRPNHLKKKKKILENIFRRLVRTKKLQNMKNATVAVAGFGRACLAEFGQNCRIPARLLRIPPDPAEMARIRGLIHTNPVRSDQIPAILARSDWLLTILATVVGCSRIPASAVFRWPDVFRIPVPPRFR